MGVLADAFAADVRRGEGQRPIAALVLRSGEVQVMRPDRLLDDLTPSRLLATLRDLGYSAGLYDAPYAILAFRGVVYQRAQCSNGRWLDVGWDAVTVLYIEGPLGVRVSTLGDHPGTDVAIDLPKPDALRAVFRFLPRAAIIPTTGAES